MRARIVWGAAALAFAMSPVFIQAAQAKITQFRVVLSGNQETPPHPGKGKGFGMAVFDDKTRELRWKIS